MIKCNAVIQTLGGKYMTVEPEAVVAAYLCKKCSDIHLCVKLGDYVYAVADLTDDQAQKLGKDLINPPTAEGIGLVK